MELTPSVDVGRLDFHFTTRSVFLGLTLHLASGLTWLRGRNGRGKTTLLKLLGGALAPAAGNIRLDGLDSRIDALAYRGQSFYCGCEAPMLDWLTVSEWLDLHLSLYGAAAVPRLDALLDAFRIGDIARQPVTGLSLGQYKKLQLALGLALPVKLLLMDEPFNGLDTHAIGVLERSLAERMLRHDACIVLTSHVALGIEPNAVLDLDDQPGVL